MRRWIRGFIIPHTTPSRIWTLEDWFVHIQIVNITDFFFAASLTVDTVALWVIALLSVLNCSSEVHSYLHSLGEIKRISPNITRHFFLGGMRQYYNSINIALPQIKKRTLDHSRIDLSNVTFWSWVLRSCEKSAKGLALMRSPDSRQISPWLVLNLPAGGKTRFPRRF